jgi:hypothetical protein
MWIASTVGHYYLLIVIEDGHAFVVLQAGLGALLTALEVGVGSSDGSSHGVEGEALGLGGELGG